MLSQLLHSLLYVLPHAPAVYDFCQVEHGTKCFQHLKLKASAKITAAIKTNNIM